jgi:hypothetical protein
LLVSVTASDFFLARLSSLIYIFMSLHVVAGLFEPLDVWRLHNGIDAVTRFSRPRTVFINLDPERSHQVQHRLSVWVRDRNAVAWHG